jgi:hypothetical protein
VQLSSQCKPKFSGILHQVAGRTLLLLQGPCCVLSSHPPATQRHIQDDVHLQSLTRQPQIPPTLASLAYTLWGVIAILIHNLLSWRSWLSHCATNRTVAGLITVGVTWIFHLHKLCVRTVALGLTQPLTEMSTRNISLRVKAAGG